MSRDPRLLVLLGQSTPAFEPVEEQWSRPMRITAYVGADEIPDDLITSIRVVVLVGDEVVVCTNRDGVSHVLPGGGREPDESCADTACREIHEETGWLLDPDSIEPIGWLHLVNLGDPVPPFPYPDAVHLIVTARATERAAAEWTDTEGYELTSRLAPLADVAAVDPLCVPYLELLRARA